MGARSGTTDLLESIGVLVGDALANIEPPAGNGRPSTKAIYETLKKMNSVRSALAREFGGPVKCRYAGCPPVVKEGKHQKVLGYLWDFSFSRFSIPNAIQQDKDALPDGAKYEMLMVVESELGDETEICRDLLKLLDARAAVRVLVYRQPKDARCRERLHGRMVRVLHNHAHFDPATDRWLFVGLTWRPGSIRTNVYTVTADGARFRELASSQ